MSNGKRWSESQPGRTSAMRVMAVPGFYCGIIIAFFGAAGVLFMDKANAISVFWGGLTFSGACLTGKTFQRGKE